MPEQQLNPLSASRLIGEVCDPLGVGKEAFQDVAEPLDRLVDSMNRDAALHASGVLRAIELLKSSLRLRHELIAARPRHPGSFRRQVIRPMFIIGLPRTGTTLLHHLLNQDPENRTPQLWELSHPLPPPDPGTYASNPRIAQTEYELERLMLAQPSLRRVQMQQAQEPADSSLIFNRCLLSPHFLVNYHVPDYAQWLWQQPLEDLYRWYRDELLLLQTNVLGSWVLRSPFHLWGIESLLSTFPDALLVHTHREPMDLLASGASYCETLRAGHSDQVDPLVCGRDWTGLVQRYATHFEEWHAGAAQPERDAVIDVSYRQLVADPLAAVVAIYRAWGRKLGLDARMRMQVWLKKHPRHAQGEHVYDAARYGLDPATATQAFGAYTERCKAYF